MYWEQSIGGLQLEYFYRKVEDEDCDIQKPQKPEIQSNEDEEHIEDLTVNIVLIMELHMINELVSNNYRNERFGKHRFEDELSRVLAESIEVFTQSSRVFA
jgi:hypothetical protein